MDVTVTSEPHFASESPVHHPTSCHETLNPKPKNPIPADILNQVRQLDGTFVDPGPVFPVQIQGSPGLLLARRPWLEGTQHHSHSTWRPEVEAVEFV